MSALKKTNLGRVSGNVPLGLACNIPDMTYVTICNAFELCSRIALSWRGRPLSPLYILCIYSYP